MLFTPHKAHANQTPDARAAKLRPQTAKQKADEKAAHTYMLSIAII